MRPLLLLLTACSLDEPLDLPTDPSTPGVPVGVRTIEVGGITMDVWYPATDATASSEPETIDLAGFIPQSFLDAVPGVPIPTYPSRAVRDAEPRNSGLWYPVVLFSHGFGGFRDQSVDLTSHLASRGYVVIAPDHVGRNINDVVPCLIEASAADCNLSFDLTEDPGPEDLAAALAWAEGGGDWLTGLLDAETVGVFGHSAGGGSTTAFANDDLRVDAALPMAGAGEFTRDVRSAVLGGSCDGVVSEGPSVGTGVFGSFDSPGLAATGPSTSDGYWSVAGAGHMAFSDLCEGDLGGVGEALLAREDVINLLADQLIGLATDGCPGYAPPPELACGETYLPLETSAPLLRYAVTAFFDAHLKGQGSGLRAGAYEALIQK